MPTHEPDDRSLASVQRLNLNGETSAASSQAAVVLNAYVAASDKPSAVQIASTADLSFVLNLQKRFAAQLGFLPTVALEDYIQRGRVKLVMDNGQPAGYLLGNEKLRCARHVAPLTHTAICYDAQRRLLGAQLVDAAVDDATNGGRSIVQCWCRVDLDANKFWSALGFVAVAIRRPDTSRGLPLILWRRPLNLDGERRLLHIPTQAGYRAITTDPRRLLTALERRRYVADSITHERLLPRSTAAAVP